MSQPPYAPPPVLPQGAQQWSGDQSAYGPQQTQQYAQMPPGQQYGPPVPQPPAKTPFYKKKWFIFLAVIVVLGIFANMANGGTADTDGTDGTASGMTDTPAVDAAAPAADSPAAPVEDAAPAEANPGIGVPADDGDFSFVVSGVDCSLTRIGNEYFGTEAQGQFCVVNVAVTNIGDSAQSFFGDNAKLFNAQGQEFSADTEAAIYLEDSASIYEEINPGNTLNSKVVFDVPAGTTPTSVELHDSAFSGGVTVSLQ